MTDFITQADPADENQPDEDERWREIVRHGLRSLLRDAESENARLREHVAALREALKPFATMYVPTRDVEKIASTCGVYWCYDTYAEDGLTKNDLVRAWRVLGEAEDWRAFEAKEATREEGV